jgi:hypothetical protein
MQADFRNARDGRERQALADEADRRRAARRVEDCDRRLALGLSSPQR